jgi:hypothetical protein
VGSQSRSSPALVAARVQPLLHYTTSCSTAEWVDAVRSAAGRGIVKVLRPRFSKEAVPRPLGVSGTWPLKPRRRAGSRRHPQPETARPARRESLRIIRPPMRNPEEETATPAQRESLRRSCSPTGHGQRNNCRPRGAWKAAEPSNPRSCSGGTTVCRGFMDVSCPQNALNNTPTKRLRLRAPVCSALSQQNPSRLFFNRKTKNGGRE